MQASIPDSPEISLSVEKEKNNPERTRKMKAMTKEQIFEIIRNAKNKWSMLPSPEKNLVAPDTLVAQSIFDSLPDEKEELSEKKLAHFLSQQCCDHLERHKNNPCDSCWEKAKRICKNFSRPRVNLDHILSLLPKEKEFKPSRFHMYKQNISQEWCDGWNAYKKQAEENLRVGFDDKKGQPN